MSADQLNARLQGEGNLCFQKRQAEELDTVDLHAGLLEAAREEEDAVILWELGRKEGRSQQGFGLDGR